VAHVRERAPLTEECGLTTQESAQSTSSTPGSTPGSAAATRFADVFESIAANVQQAIQGKSDVVDLALLCLVSEGHLLIEDVPGVGKTSLAKALARSIDCTFGRVQFTPDLLPSDVVGVTVWNRNDGLFEFRPGPVFSSIVLGDEINRASPKTQSALLEAMAEGQVTVDNITYPLGQPFLVIATQNPIEHEGTYPLPESQLDRFLMRVSVGYPDRQAEIDVLDAHSDHSPLDDIGPVADVSAIESMISWVRSVHVAPSLRGYLVDIADVTRRHPQLLLGMSPRATLSKALADPVLSHRLLITPDAQLQGVTSREILADILDQIPVPTSAN
jgi:MoxR-like ATPase